MQKNKRKVGAFYEEIAADYLVSQGVMILERNYRNWLGEIDLIGMTADGWLIFVEVKYRSSERSGSPLAAVNGRKQLVISKVAVEYLKNHYRSMDVRCRFDAVSYTHLYLDQKMDSFTDSINNSKEGLGDIE